MRKKLIKRIGYRSALKEENFTFILPVARGWTLPS